MYIALIETITSPSCKLFYCADMSHSSFRRWVVTVFHNTFSFRMRLQSSLDSASIALMSLSVKNISYQYCYQFRTSSLTYVRGGAPYPSGHSLPLLSSAFLSALAMVYVLSVALLRSVSSILLSFAGDASPSIGLLALRSERPLRVAALARGSYRDPSLGAMSWPPARRLTKHSESMHCRNLKLTLRLLSPATYQPRQPLPRRRHRSTLRYGVVPWHKSSAAYCRLTRLVQRNRQ